MLPPAMLPDGTSTPAAVYLVDLSRAGGQVADEVLGLLRPLLQEPRLGKVVHGWEQVGRGGGYCCPRLLLLG